MSKKIIHLYILYVKVNGLKINFQIKVRSNVFDDVRHRVRFRSLHLKTTMCSNLAIYRYAVLSHWTDIYMYSLKVKWRKNQNSCDSHIDTKREISQMHARVLCKKRIWNYPFTCIVYSHLIGYNMYLDIMKWFHLQLFSK